ncbi:MAG: Na/Pi cotransporter family protein [Deltaproteobacteria bacterium]|nr:Na/Pi cotransporter family protein [Nannocystaceae bacterium]
MTTPAPLEWQPVILGLLGGLGLFLYGLGQMSEALQAVAGKRAERVLARLTTNRFAGVATGTIATVVLDSSSTTIILVIGLVTAGLLSFPRALPIVLGANVGTTFSSLIVALNVTEYAPLALLAGVLMRAIAKGERWKRYGSVLLALGLVFFGLELIGQATTPLQDHPPFLRLLERLEHPSLAILAGAGATAVIQSSSAMMGIVITFALQGVCTLSVGVGLMMGAELGTCLDTLVASVGRSRAALRTGVFQIMFNVANVLLWMAFTDQLAALATRLADDVPKQLAYAHIIFNVSGVLVALPFTNLLARALERMVPEPGGSRLRGAVPAAT